MLSNRTCRVCHNFVYAADSNARKEWVIEGEEQVCHISVAPGKTRRISCTGKEVIPVKDGDFLY